MVNRLSEIGAAAQRRQCGGVSAALWSRVSGWKKRDPARTDLIQI